MEQQQLANQLLIIRLHVNTNIRGSLCIEIMRIKSNWELRKVDYRSK